MQHVDIFSCYISPKEPIQAAYLFCLFEIYRNTGEYLTLNDWSRGEQWILFPENLNVSRDEVEGNIAIQGKHWDSREQSLSDLLFSKTKKSKILKTALSFQRSRATAVNISRVTVNCFPFDVIVLAMLPAHGIWQETASLLDLMWPWTSQ